MYLLCARQIMARSGVQILLCKAQEEEEQPRKRVEMEGIEPWKERAVSGWCSPRYRLRMSRLRL